jgi:hypothetical protein
MYIIYVFIHVNACIRLTILLRRAPPIEQRMGNGPSQEEVEKVCHIYIYIYLYVYICICVRVCICIFIDKRDTSIYEIRC